MTMELDIIIDITLRNEAMTTPDDLLALADWRRTTAEMYASVRQTKDSLRAWQDHKRVVAPRVSWEQRRMMPTELRSLTSDLVESAMGLREPVSGAPIPISIIDLVIVPGLAFDDSGNRLGRGRGFYDRFLAHPEFDGVTCGLAFDEQLLGDIPATPLDRPVSMLVTDQRVRRYRHR